MTLHVNIALEIELGRVLEIMDKYKKLKPEEQLKKIRKYLEETKESARKGWL